MIQPDILPVAHVTASEFVVNKLDTFDICKAVSLEGLVVDRFRVVVPKGSEDGIAEGSAEVPGYLSVLECVDVPRAVAACP